MELTHQHCRWHQAGELVNILKDRAAIQNDLDRLEEWADRDLVKLNKHEC